MIYDKAYNTLFHQILQKIQYNSAYAGAIKRAIRQTFKEKLYQELGLESAGKKNDGIENSLNFIGSLTSSLLHTSLILYRSYFTRYVENVSSFKVRHKFLKISFFILL